VQSLTAKQQQQHQQQQRIRPRVYLSADWNNSTGCLPSQLRRILTDSAAHRDELSCRSVFDVD